ncbi:MAG: transcription antitermination factor NusB [Pseudomonadota bacterium]
MIYQRAVKPTSSTSPETGAATPAGLESRRAALDILSLIRKGRSLDEALSECRSFDALIGPDRAFARALATESLRRRGGVDHVLGAYLDRPLPRKAAKVMDILRLAATQSLVLQTPDHAAVSTAVDLAGEYSEAKGYAKLINAVARKVAKNGPAVFATLPPRTETPGWLWRTWERGYGPVGAKGIALAHQSIPPTDLTPKSPDAARNLADALGGELTPTGSIRLKNVSDVTALSGYDAGDWWVQDMAAALPARLLGDIAGKSVYDLCAAPGGKTMQLCAAGARVTAVDKSELRLRRVAENLDRTKLKAEIVNEDVLMWVPKSKADAILLDASCSATGTIRRHPDIPWTKTPDDIAGLQSLQQQMIDHAVTFLKPGGLLIYCVCSLQREEGELQASAALQRHQNFIREPIDPKEVGLSSEAITRDGDLRTLPSHFARSGGMDGFFAVRFRKSA